MPAEQTIDLFKEFRDSILNIDPINFVETNLTLDGKPFRLTNNGYKPFADIYRYIAVKALEPNSLPVILVKGRQVGATTMAAALECYFMASGLFGQNSRPPIAVAHLFPTIAMAQAYAKTKFNPLVSAARISPNGETKANGKPKTIIESLLDNSNPSNDSLNFKRFLGENQLMIESAGIDGGRIRGRTLDILLWDEIQDISRIAVGAANKVLSTAKFGQAGEGVQVYFGTPKQKNSAYWEMWNVSTQQYYHLKCQECQSFFPLYRPDVNWEKIWLFGWTVRCTECGYEQDKRLAAEDGKWIPYRTFDTSLPEDDDRNKIKYVGYHINQLYVPMFPKEYIIGQKPENSPINTERIYQNEVLGEFYDGEGATISIDHIHNLCADQDRKFSSGISQEENRRVYAGFDWGQRGNLEQMAGRQRGQSYSCGVLITVPQPQFIQIEYGMRLAKNDPGYKEEIVEELFRRFGIFLSVGDIGDAFDLTHILQTKYQNKFLASRALTRVSGHVRFQEDTYPKEIQFERDYYISELMGLLKSGNVRFPFGSYERCKWLIDHCCSMEVKVTVSRSGDPVRRYVKGPSPNDGFMALLNAYLAYKYDITQGFTIQQPKYMKFEVSQKKPRIPAVLGYLPGCH